MAKALLFPIYILLTLLLLTPLSGVQAQAVKVTLSEDASADEVISNWESVSNKISFIKEVVKEQSDDCYNAISDLDGRMKEINLRLSETKTSVESYKNPTTPSAKSYEVIAFEDLTALSELVDPLWNDVMPIANEELISQFGYHPNKEE